MADLFYTTNFMVKAKTNTVADMFLYKPHNKSPTSLIFSFFPHYPPRGKWTDHVVPCLVLSLSLSLSSYHLFLKSNCIPYFVPKLSHFCHLTSKNRKFHFSLSLIFLNNQTVAYVHAFLCTFLTFLKIWFFFFQNAIESSLTLFSWNIEP